MQNMTYKKEVTQTHTIIKGTIINGIIRAIDKSMLIMFVKKNVSENCKLCGNVNWEQENIM